MAGSNLGRFSKAVGLEIGPTHPRDRTLPATRNKLGWVTGPTELALMLGSLRQRLLS